MSTTEQELTDILAEALAWVKAYGHDWEHMPEWVAKAEDEVACKCGPDWTDGTAICQQCKRVRL